MLNARGDYLLNLPTLRALAQIGKDSFVLVVRRGARETYLRDIPARGVVEVDATYLGDGYHFDSAEVAGAVEAFGEVGTFVSLNPWRSPSLDLLVDALAPERAVGLGNGAWTDMVPLDFSCHSSELAFRTLLAFDRSLRIGSFAHPPAYPDGAMRLARGLRDEVSAGRLLVIHRETKPDKEWTDARWVDFLRSWLSMNQADVAVDVSLKPLPIDPTEPLADRVLHGLGLPLDHAFALSSVADLFVGVDSCFLHAADLARVPSVGLFFSTDPVEFGLRWAPHCHLTAAEAADLRVDTVRAALATLSDAPRSAAAGRVPGRATPAGTRRVALRHGGEAPFRERQDMQLSTLGLGTARFSFSRDLDAVDVLLKALEMGCNVVDMGGNYGGGEACAVVGRGLRRAFAAGTVARDEVFLCSKAGFTEHLDFSAAARSRGWTQNGHCMRADYLRWEFERQCSYLGVDGLDAFLLHNPEEAVQYAGASFWQLLESAFTLLEDLVSQGKLSLYGISTAEALRVSRSDPHHLDLADLWEVATAVGGRQHHFRVIELPVSASRLEGFDVPAHRKSPAKDGTLVSALKWAETREMMVLASTPLNGGGRIEALGAAVGDLLGIRDPATSLLQVARSIPGVTCALVGVTTPQHLANFETVLRSEFPCLATKISH
ncbi:aldo/keto reductase [Streptomyces sp. M2CJ-2]|nr:aldo/keto reductase [Streptomyces sp. M2CJ-2]